MAATPPPCRSSTAKTGSNARVLTAFPTITASPQRHNATPTSTGMTDPFTVLWPPALGSFFGVAAEDELKIHLFKYHGIDMFTGDDDDDGKFLDPPKEKAGSTAKAPATFQCDLCDKKFTRNHNLKSHRRTHEGIKPFGCSMCAERCTRKPDCGRHERSHGDKKFTCVGPLQDGGT